MQKRTRNFIRWKAAVFLLFTGILLSVWQPQITEAATQKVSVTSCKLNGSGSKLTVKAKVKQKTSAMGKKLYLLGLNAYGSETGTKAATPLASVKAKKGTITFKVKYKSSMLFQKFVVAYKKGKKYTIVSDARYITNPEALASYKGKGPSVTSKKGLQVEELSDSLEIGTQHAVVNWTLNSLLNNNANNKISFTYKKKTYYLDADMLARNDELVQAYNAAGVRVTVILLLPKDPASSGTAAMQYGGYSYTKFSSFKTSSKASCRTFEAVMTYLAKRYGTKNNLVSGWILGNEVNSACIWNYGGNKSLSAYMANYARAFRICYNAVKSVSKYAKVYISLDNNWNKDMDGSGKRYFSSKATVDKFYEKLKAQGTISFQIAWHAYPQEMGNPIFWNDSQATNSTSAGVINFKNLSVLTNYAKKNFGKNCTVMLSEQSFNSNRGEIIQATAYAYAYYISECNSMVEAFIYGREFDHPEEMKSGFNWGLCNNQHGKRLIWSVFQYIDTKDSFKFTDPLVKYTNIKKWTKISGFKRAKYTGMASRRKKAVITAAESISNTEIMLTWDKINAGDGYEILRNGKVIATISGNSTVTYTDKKLTTGTTYKYQVRMYKEAPDASDANKRVKLYGTLSSAVSAVPSTGQVVLDESKCTVTGNQIKIVWKKLSGVSGYQIFRSTAENGAYTCIGEAAASAASYTDKSESIVSGTTYYYKVRAYVTVKGSNYYGKESKPVSKLALIKLTAKVENGKVVLNWTRWQNEVKYRVYCKPDVAGSRFVRIKTLSALTYSCRKYIDGTGAKPEFAVNETYCFRVRAYFGDGTYSKYSNVVTLDITHEFNNAATTPEQPKPVVTAETPKPQVTAEEPNPAVTTEEPKQASVLENSGANSSQTEPEAEPDSISEDPVDNTGETEFISGNSGTITIPDTGSDDAKDDMG